MLKQATVHDIRAVERIIGHSTVFSSSCDDGINNPELAFEVAFWWLTTQGSVVFLGDDYLIMFQRRNFITYEMHLGFIEDARVDVKSKVLEAVKLLFDNTHAEKIVAMIPEYNRCLIRYAKVCGMKHEGISKHSYRKDGELFDCVLLGATKKEIGGVICHQQ